mgnify:FL=1
MRVDRDRLISGMRNLGMDEDRGQVEAAIKMMVRDELSALQRKRVKRIFADEDIDQAVEEGEDIEDELLSER